MPKRRRWVPEDSYGHDLAGILRRLVRLDEWLVSYPLHRDGFTLEDAAEYFGVEAQQLRRDFVILEKVFGVKIERVPRSEPGGDFRYRYTAKTRPIFAATDRWLRRRRRR